jgi:LmbE family N-acetylglucosaminyl deacetylase
MKTLLAIGAHYDDAPYGLGGLLLQAIEQHHRVVVLNLIGDYSNWPPVKGRHQQLVEFSIEQARQRGIEMRFLNHASGQFMDSIANRRQVAEVVAEVKPDTAFLLWPRDRHPDHEAASAIANAALHGPGRLIGREATSPREIYWYDNGPGHTIDFTPDTYFDVSAQWPAAQDWLAQLMAFVRNRPLDPQKDSAVEGQNLLARYRGQACGVRHAEALRAVRPVARSL